MNAATITIAVLAFVIICQRVRMCMWEDYASRLEHMAHQALNQRDRYARRCAHKDATIGDYVRDCDAVTAHMALLEARNSYFEQRRSLVLRRWWSARRNRSYAMAAWALKGVDGR